MDLYFQKCQLKHVLGSQRLAAVENHRGNVQTKVTNLVKERQKRKLEVLVAKQSPSDDHGNRRVVSLSSRHLEDPHLSALSKGLNFAPVLGSIPKAHIVASVEAAISRAKASGSEAAKAHMNVIGAISRARLPPNLAKDGSILVLPADKSKATVVMNRADYDAKMELMLNDESTYVTAIEEGPHDIPGEEDECSTATTITDGSAFP